MAVNFLPLCFLGLCISGTYSSGQNKTRAETDEIKIEALHEEQSNKSSYEYKSNNENISSIAKLEDVDPITIGKEGENQFVESNSSEAFLISSQGPSSKVHQHSIQTTAQTLYRSTSLDNKTLFASKIASAKALKSNFVSNLPGIVSPSNDSSSALIGVTYTSTNKTLSDSMRGSSQHFIQTSKTPHSSITSDKVTSSVSNNKSETALISHSVSNIPGAASSTTDSINALTNVTNSTVDKPSTMESIEGSSKDSYTLFPSTEVNYSQSTMLTSVTSEASEHLLNTSRKTSKVVIVLAAIGGSLLAIVALLVYLKYRKRTGALPPEYLSLSP